MVDCDAPSRVNTPCTNIECFADPLRDPLFENFILNKKIKKSNLEIPNKPGLGIELNEEIIKKYQVKPGRERA